MLAYIYLLLNLLEVQDQSRLQQHLVAASKRMHSCSEWKVLLITLGSHTCRMSTRLWMDNYINIMNDNSHNATMIMIITVPFGFRSKIGLNTSPFMWMNFTFSIKELCFRCEAKTAKYSARLWWYLRLRKSFEWKHSCRRRNTILFNVILSPNPFIIYKIIDFHSRCSITRF